jgi:FAD/FMN-containing dehydrogenase
LRSSEDCSVGRPFGGNEAAVYGTVSLYRGSISAEHGIGSLKKDFLRLSRSPEEVALTRTLKRAMDPNGILNPGKIF